MVIRKNAIDKNYDCKNFTAKMHILIREKGLRWEVGKQNKPMKMIKTYTKVKLW